MYYSIKRYWLTRETITRQKVDPTAVKTGVLHWEGPPRLIIAPTFKQHLSLATVFAPPLSRLLRHVIRLCFSQCPSRYRVQLGYPRSWSWSRAQRTNHIMTKVDLSCEEKHLFISGRRSFTYVAVLDKYLEAL